MLRTFAKIKRSTLILKVPLAFNSDGKCQTDLLDALRRYSLDEKVCKDIVKNKFICEQLALICQHQSFGCLEKKTGNLVYSFVSRSQFLTQEQRLAVCDYIIKGQIHHDAQIEESLNFFRKHKTDDLSDKNIREEFERLAGINVRYTEKDLMEYVCGFVERHKNEVLQKSHHTGILAQLKNGLKFANPKSLLECYTKRCQMLQEQYANFCEKKGTSNSATSSPSDQNSLPRNADLSDSKIQDSKSLSQPKFRANCLLARDLQWGVNSQKASQKHFQRVGDAVITRFPPEPNGFLHIGHCKAMRFNFRVAQEHTGLTILRYDDSNPETENIEYIKQIEQDVRWMGYSPAKITFASDYFDRILKCAFDLIKRGKAYVCLLSPEQSKQLRESCAPSPYRDRTIQENLQEFQKMVDGVYREGEAVLRAKIDYQSVNPCMRDPVIYRIKNTHHPKTGDKYRVYPIYDFVHPLCDSFEDITHSLCTLEFENRRELYYWPLEALDLYKPYVWEYSRLNITYNILSKRKLLILIKEGLVDGWDDPRLMTIKGIRRRGYPPEAINDFCDSISVTRRGNDLFIDYSFFEHKIRDYLKKVCPKAFCVQHPIELEIGNLDLASEKQLDSELIHELRLSKTVLVDASDVRLVDQPDFYGISPGKIVRLRYGPFIRIKEVKIVTVDSIKDAGQMIDVNNYRTQNMKILAELVDESTIDNVKSIKGILHWLPAQAAIDCELRLFEPLFTEKVPGEKTGKFLDDFNHESKQIVHHAKISKELFRCLTAESKLQFERLGYFCVDQDSDISAHKIVFNRITALKDKQKTKTVSDSCES